MAHRLQVAPPFADCLSSLDALITAVTQKLEALILTRSQYSDAVLKSGYIYQLYTYLRSQERTGDPLSLTASGLFLHPTVDGDLDESVRIQGHDIRFATVDLSKSTFAVLERLRALVPAGRG